MCRARWLIAIGVLLASTLPASAQGRLSAVRDAVRPPQTNENEVDEDDDDNRPSSSCPCDDDSIPVDIRFLFYGLFPQLYEHRYRGYRRVVIDESRRTDGTIVVQEIIYQDDPHLEKKLVLLAFPAYPYPLGLSGYMQVDPTDVSELTGNPNHELDLKHWSVRLSLEDGHNFDGLNRFNGTLQAETTLGLGIYTGWNWLHEELPCGCDDVALGNITATWRNVETEYFLMRWGVGAWLFTDRIGTESGVNVHLSADLFPARPWVISSVIEGGSIGEAGIFHVRATVGYLFHGLEIFAGYDLIRIEDTNLQGPLAGVRLWF